MPEKRFIQSSQSPQSVPAPCFLCPPCEISVFSLRDRILNHENPTDFCPPSSVLRPLSSVLRPPPSDFSMSAFARADFSFSAFARADFSFCLGNFSFCSGNFCFSECLRPGRQAGRTALLWGTHLCFQLFSFSAFAWIVSAFSPSSCLPVPSRLALTPRPSEPADQSIEGGNECPPGASPPPHL